MIINFAINDILRSVKDIDVALYIAFSDTKARYKRSVLGPFWITLGTALGAAGLGLVWGSLMNLDFKNFIPSLTIGLITWQFITGVVLESPSVFMKNSTLIRNVNRPYFFHSINLVIRHLINFCHNFLVFLIVCGFTGSLFQINFLFAFLSLCLLTINLIFLSLILAILGARVRDLEPLIFALMPIMFFISPVVYRADKFPISAEIVWSNPFTYYLSVIRDPLLGHNPSVQTLVIFSLITIFLIISSLLLFTWKRSKIPFWV